MGLAAFDCDGEGIALPLGLAGDGQAGNGTDRGQGFAAEAHRADIEKIVLAILAHGKLGGGVALDAESEFRLAHPLAVILDDEADQTSALGGDVDPAGAGIQRILRQFLDHGSRTLDDFARRNAVDGLRRQTADDGMGRGQRHRASLLAGPESVKCGHLQGS